VDPKLLPLLAFLAFILAIIALSSVLAKRQQRKVLENLTGLATRLGLELKRKPAKFGFEPAPTVEGRYRNRPIRFYNYTTGSGKSRRYWSALSVDIGNDNGLTLELASENFLTRMATALGMQDIAIGDPAFDTAFLIRSNNAAYAAAALLPEIRARLLSKRDQSAVGELTVKGGVVRDAEVGAFDDAARVDRMAGILDVLCDLAEVAEVYQA
jgi:hypothetical protein